MLRIAMKTNPVITIGSSQKALRVPRRKILSLVPFVARAQGVRLARVDIAVVASRAMAGLNRRWLGHAGDTDVLSFDLSGPEQCGIVAQIVVCGDVAARQAPHHGHTSAQELLLYIVHGLLHLMGHDDSTVRGAARMHAREEELLRAFLAL